MATATRANADGHEKCVGWRPDGFCGCCRGLCGLRLTTGVMWDVIEHDNQGEP